MLQQETGGCKQHFSEQNASAGTASQAQWRAASADPGTFQEIPADPGTYKCLLAGTETCLEVTSVVPAAMQQELAVRGTLLQLPVVAAALWEGKLVVPETLH